MKKFTKNLIFQQLCVFRSTSSLVEKILIQKPSKISKNPLNFNR